MSREQEVSAKRKLSLYKKSIMANSPEQDYTNYRNYRNLYNKAKREMKINYYSKMTLECKKNTKNYGKSLMT